MVLAVQTYDELIIVTKTEFLDSQDLMLLDHEIISDISLWSDINSKSWDIKVCTNTEHTPEGLVGIASLGAGWGRLKLHSQIENLPIMTLEPNNNGEISWLKITLDD